MAKKTTKKTASKPAARARRGPRDDGPAFDPATAAGKRLVIVESPAKAKTINKYLGSGYIVKASVGHIRDLPTKAPKGDKSPVPGVDLERNFEPTYEVLEGKGKTVSDLKRAAKAAAEVWFATDLDREGEAIAWHLAQLLGIDPSQARRVVFNAITKDEIQRAFQNPHPIDQSKVDAQQARRILDRIVGYQVSPLLWKKVARGLSAGRVQSVAVRLVVEREREIRAFMPDEYWSLTARFALSPAEAAKLGPQWAGLLAQRDAKGNPPTVREQNAWLGQHRAITAELVGVGGDKFDLSATMDDRGRAPDLAPRVEEIARLAGLKNARWSRSENPKAKGLARNIRALSGDADPATPYRVVSIETKRTRTRPPAPFITSTLQQAASSRLGFGAQRTMRTAQRLYEGIEIKGEGAVGLITYMRTDSTHISGAALSMVREFIGQRFGPRYLPESPNFFGSSNKAAQEAHEAIRPTSLDYPPSRVKDALEPDQFRLYSLIWERFIACQMTAAEWDSTAVSIKGGADPARPLTFRATGRVLVFDGFYKVAGVPTSADEQTLPALAEQQPLSAFSLEPEQKFTSPPPRYSEASLIKKLEEEGIGRPSTYASIISVIQDRKYVEQLDRRFYATDLGEVVTDKLTEAFPEIMELSYTREMEAELDHIEDERKDWRQVLQHFYDPFRAKLEHAHDNLSHAKAETTPAPKEYRCGKCGSDTVYRFGKNGRFLSCSTYPKCDYAAPVDRDGVPRPPEHANVACHKCGSPMNKRTGRFGAFLGCSRYPECDGILKLDKAGNALAPAMPPMDTDVPCAKCGSMLYVRSGARGPWLSCSAFPRCRGRGKWTDLPPEKAKALEDAFAAHERAHPTVIIKDLQGHPLTDAKGKPLASAKGGKAGQADDDFAAEPSDDMADAAV
ncbi:MAG: type I DNA topoisomerase [Phycisphaerales bacterium]|nr:type I DNA topoisomerase [Phycisphaerales bacterium]